MESPLTTPSAPQSPRLAGKSSHTKIRDQVSTRIKESPQLDGGFFNNREPFSIELSTQRFIRTIFFCLLGFEVLLVFLDATVNYGRWTNIGAIRRLFNLARDDGLGNWFASTQTLFVGLVLWLVFLKTKKDDQRKAWGWALLAVFFTYLAVDDGAKIHERIGTALKDSAGLVSFPSYPWHLVFGPFLGAMGVFTLIFLWSELKDHTLRILLILGMGCYVTAIGLDFAEGLKGSDPWIASSLSTISQDIRHFAKVFEEFLEMIGTTFFFVCLLSHFERNFSGLSIRFNK